MNQSLREESSVDDCKQEENRSLAVLKWKQNRQLEIRNEKSFSDKEEMLFMNTTEACLDVIH